MRQLMREIGDVFAKRQAAVDGDARHALPAVVIGDDLLAEGLKLRPVGVGPPVVQAAGFIVVGAIAVKGVGDLMRNGEAQRTKIFFEGGRWIVERRLQHCHR